ncbi:MAG: alpha/beta fold hydrolase [Gammaproteobacteria bacterium]
MNSIRILAWAAAMVFSLGFTTPGAAAADEARASIELEPCRFAGLGALRAVRGECGSLTVPVDYDDPTGATITLSVARLKALKRSTEPVAITVIAGGPGQSSLDFYAGYHPAFRRMREVYDIILVDQRGTGESAKLACDTPDDSMGGLWTVEQTVAITQTCLAKLKLDPKFFTTSMAVRDLDAVRSAMGYEQLSVYGISYGTRVAQHYLRRYPKRTHSVILDGVVPVDEALGPDIALLAERALQSAFDRCADDADCNAAFPDLETRFSALIERIQDAPISVTLNHPITAEPTTLTLGHLDLAGAIRLLSYAPQTVALLPLMIHEAAEGNLVPLAAQALTVSQNLVDSMAYGMHNAVVCAEDAPFFDDVNRDALEQTYLGTPIYDSLAAVCDAWPAGVIDDDFKTPFASEVPVLVLSGEADPITPPDYGKRVVGYLKNARHIVGLGQGHGMAPVGCAPKLMGDFVRDRDLQALDASCLNRQGPSPFFLSFAGPAP